MATNAALSPADRSLSHEGLEKDGLFLRSTALPKAILRPFASLKITVALFAMGIFIILVGTLAQVDKDMWEVIDLYFRSWIAWIDFQVFFPRSWFPMYQDIGGGFWFPGGAAIGAIMVLNLFAAHLVRFKIQASGSRLASGLLIMGIGTLMTTYIIVSGHNHAGLQGEPPFSWQTLWSLVKGGMAFGCAASIVFALRAGTEEGGKATQRLWWVAATLLAGISLWLFLASENAYLGDSGMRILWQLIQSTVCGLVLLAGSVLVFARRGGIFVIHAGIGLLMFGQFFVSKYDVEEQLRIDEGQTKSYAEDVRQTELAVIDSSCEEEDQVTVVPRSVLLASLEKNSSSVFASRHREVSSDGIIRHPSLPFDMQLVKYYRNAALRDAKPGESNLATRGLGQRVVAEAAKSSAGADSDATVDLAAAYVRLIDKDGSGDLGTYLVSQLASAQDVVDKVTVDNKTYGLSLRFRRNYKPYLVTLKDVRKDDYVGTSTPRNYSSAIRLQDESLGVDREITIWMNNPLRYAGETFYQSGYQLSPTNGVESTTISVVTNAGWMIPYVACMIVFVGLTYHFGGMLLQFQRTAGSRAKLKTGAGTGDVVATNRTPARPSANPNQTRKSDEKGRIRDDAASLPSFAPSSMKLSGMEGVGTLFPVVVVALFAIVFFGSMWSRAPGANEMNLREFGRLPVIADGRVKPFDTLARNTLRALSNRETFRDENDKRQPAIRWLLDVISQSKSAENHPVIRIDNLEVLDLLGLKRRKSHLYSIAELRPQAKKFNEQIDKAQADSKAHGPENLSVYQRKLIELDGRIHTYTRVSAAFEPPLLPPLPTREEYENDRATADQKLAVFRDAFVTFRNGMDGIHPPLSVPIKPSADSVHQQDQTWQPYSKAFAMAVIDAQLLAKEPPASLKGMNEILASYSEGNATKFNEAVAGYGELLKRERPSELQTANSFWNRMAVKWFGSHYGFEEFFNQVAPFFFCWFPYLTAGVFAAASWLVWNRPLNRAAFWLTGFAFVVHSIALLARIYISGRPPVTNLYSSAIFIGWAVVLGCLIWEWINKDGIATFLASLLGFSTLLIAHILAGDGDTFIVLQAVLDTQFWLATHVVTVTLGYAATFLAGAIGIIYIACGFLTRGLTRPFSQELTRMIYGTTCFGMLFSFIGTVLGGLWADDSWGRFWGWDPKENGALIIVLWNALVLHARWDGLVKNRGLAVLVVGGNIVTSWSWFGVNELGVGLHSYGFTEGVLFTLSLFVASQVATIIAGCLPKSMWRSTGTEDLKRTVSAPANAESPEALAGNPLV